MHNICFCFLQVILVIYLFIMDYSKSRKGNRVLFYRGYEYLQDRFQNWVTFWRCRYYRSLKCRSSLRAENDKVIQEPIHHFHGSCPQKASAKVLQEQMKDKMTALSATNRNVIGEANNRNVIELWRFITKLPKKTNIFVRWTSLYVLLFWLVLFIVCKILPKYILDSSNLYDLGNSPMEIGKFDVDVV